MGGFSGFWGVLTKVKEETMKTSNNLEHPKKRISPQIQTVAEIFWSNLEHIKEKGAKPLIYTNILTGGMKVCENR